ncbi:MFS transporter [Chitinophaga qingshengii]|uniref:MFS transporter n=1 Tax=Chitinophaga qingshengii TaxID=1569794 RepID=A0ABR7TH95_9BACT|nr:MFS transporter [Chitinophaga qingshengii]MBC9928857.1 MFS transporter [Chitinophaga qingshengii]
MQKDTTKVPFTGYQKIVVLILALTQFTVILDFMVMSPLGDLLMKSMNLHPAQFGVAVSAYAFSAGASGLLTAGFADRFDRKKLLTFFYSGFILGTIFCGLAHTYPLLVMARIFTGLFGGVIASISMAIVTDLFDIHHRGRVMGFLMMGFGASQVLGVPISLFFANRWGWWMPFLLVAGFAMLVMILIQVKLKPVNKHLQMQKDRSPFAHLLKTFINKEYRMGYTCTALVSIGGFLMMPFGSAFAVNNLGLTNEQLPLLFMVSGITALIILPFVGKLADRIDKARLFAMGSLWMITIALIYTRLSITPLWVVVAWNVLLMIGILGRSIPANALVSAVPQMEDRGAFMSINSSLQQIAGGVAAMVAGLIVVQKDKYSPLEHYDMVGYLMTGLTMISVWMIFRVSEMIKARMQMQKA